MATFWLEGKILLWKMAYAVHRPLSNGSNRDGNYSSSSATNGNNSWSVNVTDEAAVDAYVMKVLEEASPSDVSVDADYLGPYITGVLRAEQAEANVVEELPDYENVVELLEEHCNMSRSDAQAALEKIAHAVRTGIVPSEYSTNVAPPLSSPTLGPFGSPPTSSGLNALQLLGGVNVAEAAAARQQTSLERNNNAFHPLSSTPDLPENNTTPAAFSVISPVQADYLIPVDLLGAIDDDDGGGGQNGGVAMPFAPQPSAAGADAYPSNNSALVAEDEFPSLEVAAASKTSKKASRSSRSRQGSIDDSLSEHSSKKVSPNLQATAAVGSNPYYYSLDNKHHYDDSNADPATILQMACDMLAGMNPDLGQDAIFHAATMAQSNVGVAQYLMDCAMTAPPVCRHLLNAGCYRRDCQFSHDLEGHTCVFWLRGRCGKGSACQFLHGYNTKWLEQLEQQQQQYAEDELNYATTAAHDQYYQSQWDHQQHVASAPASSSSFANIAQQGYNDQTCFQYAKSRSSSTGSQPSSVGDYEDYNTANVPSIRIPQDVWNPHERRDASVFHIPDPIERYREVSRAHNTQIASGRANEAARTDVIDLHFQSTKTFAAVLSSVLPEKLASESSGAWIVTGTGHHVGSKTHQKGGGVLESAVVAWLLDHGYEFLKGKDRNGHGGALFVKNTSFTNSIGR